MRKLFSTVFTFLIAAGYAQAINPHPRIWLTSQMLSDITAKKNASDPSWTATKFAADAIVTQKLPKLTIVSATNSNPVQFTSAEPLPWNGSTPSIYLAGATGAWVAILNNPSRNAWNATATGTNTFTIPVDSSGFGSFSGQSLTFFMAGGENNSGYLGYGQTGAGWYDALLQLGLVYKITGTQTYATQALSLLDWINTLGAAGMFQPVSQDSGRGSMGATLGVAIAYDWFYDLLSPAQKAATAVTLNLWNDWTTHNAYSLTDPTSNYWEGHVTAAAATGYATYGDNPAAQSWIDWATNNWNTNFDPKFFNPPSTTVKTVDDRSGYFYGGLAVLGYNYGGNDIARHVKYMLMLKTATGVDMFATKDYARRWAKNLLYNLKPDRWKSTTLGRWTGSYYGIMTLTEALTLAYACDGTTEGAWVQWLYTHMSPSLPSVAQPTLQEQLMFAKASRTAIDYRTTEPPFFFSDGGEAQVFWRSDWSDSADYAFVNVADSHYAGDTPKHAAHIDLTRGSDPLLVASNDWKGNSGDGTTGVPENESYSSSMQNTLYFWDGGNANGGKCFDQDSTYDGCQLGFGIYRQPTVKLTNNYAFTEGEFSTSYDYVQAPASRTLQYFFRSFVAMGDGAYLVWDRVRSTSASHTKQLRWHFSSASTPIVNADTASSTVGSSKLFVKTLMPSSAGLKLVRNLTGANQPINWRVEVTDPAPATEYSGLTMLYTTSTSGSAPTTSPITTDANHVGVQVADATPKIVVFPRGVSAVGNGTFGSATYAASSFTTSHAGTGKYLVAGLSPGTYAVTRSGSALSGYSSVVVDNTGVLYFTATSGDFTIAANGTNNPPPLLAVSSITCNPSSVISGAGSSCTVTLNTTASAGTVVTLSSSNPSVTVPGSVTVVSGAASASFTATGGAVTSSQTATLTGSITGSSATTVLTVTPAAATVAISSVQCSPASFQSGGSTTCTITLNAASPTGGIAVSVSANISALTVPASVTIPAGLTSAPFTVLSTASTSTQTAVVTATYNGLSQTASLTLQPASTGGTGTYTCVNNQFVMNADITLRNNDTVDLIGTGGGRCIVKGNSHRFISSDNTWTGHFRMQYADAYDLGTASLDILGGATAGSWFSMSSNAFVTIEDSTFHRSSGFQLYTAGSSYVSFKRNIYYADNLIPADFDSTKERAWLTEWGTSTATKYFQGNRIYVSWIDVGSPNWIIGAGRNCTACDAEGNIMIGVRVGLGVKGAGSYVSYNYTHVNLDLTPTVPSWSQVFNVHSIGQGVVAENNIFRTGHWVASGIDGELGNNVLLELNPHNFVRIGNGGLIHHNILLTLYPGLDRYLSTSRLDSGDAAFGLVQTGNALSIYNNTLDARGAAVKSVLSVVSGATLTSYRNNVTNRLNLLAVYCPTSAGCTSAIGTDFSEGFVLPPPSRALYMDYNSFFFDPASQRQVTYDVGVSGKTVCQPGWGGHDLGACPNGNVNPLFRGPLPIGSGQTGYGSPNDSGFPFNDADILAGTYPVSAMLSYFRWVYAPQPGSPLVGGQDPQDGPGDMGAVQIAKLPAQPPSIVTTNKRPMVYGGPSLNIAGLSSPVKLSGYAADDGLPLNSLTLRWTQVSGPGSVAFADANRGTTTATFSANGSYVLRLTATDGSLTSTADVAVNVGGSSPSNCDLNGDGAVDNNDVALWISMVLGLAPLDLKADLNGDGTVSVIDVQRGVIAASGGTCRTSQ